MSSKNYFIESIDYDKEIDELYNKISSKLIDKNEAIRKIKELQQEKNIYQNINKILLEVSDLNDDSISSDFSINDLHMDEVKLLQLLKKINGEYSLNVDLHDLLSYGNLEDGVNELIKDIAISKTDLFYLTEKYIQEVISDGLKISKENIYYNVDFENYGINSTIILTIMDKLEQDFSMLPKTLFFEYRNIEKLAFFFIKNKRTELERVIYKREEVEILENQNYTIIDEQNDIAVIGVSGIYPGARNIEEFFHNLTVGKDCITEIPEIRWNYKKYYSNKNHTQNKIQSKWGGFIDDIDKFDSLFFNISPREAEKMDPQERLFMQCVYNTLEDAGYKRDKLASTSKFAEGKNVGVFVGVMFEEYQFLGVEEQVRNHPITLNGSKASIANRISHYFNFQGPSIAVDTMCSSSLTSVYLACESIKNKKCEVAIAGGVNLSVHPNKYLALSEDKFLSKNGKCKSYGKDGDGYIPGEGIGSVLLKPLKSALKDGDNIYGIIKGITINHCGRTNGYSVPNPNAIADLVRNTLEEAKTNPRTISYFEGHGTGTALGDPIEIAGLTKAFGEWTKEAQFCSIGSVKSNIGHCEGAAGIAALTKVLLQMKHKKLVPSLHSEELNDNINWKTTPFYVQNKTEDWEKFSNVKNGIYHEYPRRAGITSFGAGGSNACMILEEYIESCDEQQPINFNFPIMLLLSARTTECLSKRISMLLEFLKQHKFSKRELYEIGYTLQIGREAMQERFACLAETYEEVIESLQAYIRGEVKKNCFKGRTSKDKEYIQPLIDDYIKLIEMWTEGATVRWEDLYINYRIKRISLPTYPFEKNSHWITQSLGDEEKKYVLDFISEMVHDGLKVTLKLTGEELFLKHHIINDKKVLPASAYLEILREIIQRKLIDNTDDTKRIIIENIIWTNIYIFSKDPFENELIFEITTKDNIECKAYNYSNGKQILYFSASARLAQNVSEPIFNSSGIEKTNFNKEYDTTAVYEWFEKRGIKYGQSHKCISFLLTKGKRVIARLVKTNLLNNIENYYLDPGMIDSCMQAVVGVLFDTDEETSLPFAMDKFEIFDCTEASMWAVINHKESASRTMQKFDINLYKNDGNLSVKIEGLALKNSFMQQQSGKIISCLQPIYKEEEIQTIISEENDLKLLFICGNNIPNNLQKSFHEYKVVTLKNTNENASTLYQKNAICIFKIIKKYLSNRSYKRILLQMVILGEQEEWLYSGLYSILKTAALENPMINISYILLCTNEDIENMIYNIKKEFPNKYNSKVKYCRGKRYIEYWQTIERNEQYDKHIWKTGGVYLITGGVAGLAKITVEHICKMVNNVNIICVGRKKLDQQQVSSNFIANSNIEYYQIDVTNYKEVQNLIQIIMNKYNHLDGIIHGAGVLEDNFIINKSSEHFISVLSPKVEGIVNLDEASKMCKLDFFVSYSSIAATMGNIGQVDYACANAFMDEYIHHRNELVESGRRSGYSATINWSLWENGGMQIDKLLLKQMENSTGIFPITNSKGMEVLDYLLDKKIEQTMVLEHMKKNADLIIDKLKIPLFSCQPNYKRAEKEIGSIVVKILAQVLKLSRDIITKENYFARFGINSIMSLEIVEKLETYFGKLPKTILYEHETVSDLISYLSKNYNSSENNQISMINNYKKDIDINENDIAIVGLAGKYSDASNIDEFWCNLKEGKDCITCNKENQWGGFIDGIDEFDPLFFNISPNDAIKMDPQERLFLQCAYEVLEDAGYTREMLMTTYNGNVGVYVGVMSEEYQFYAIQEQEKGYPVTASGSASAIANRVSYILNLKGPSLAIDTMCSSSLTAIFLACQGIREGLCDAAIAGGVNVLVHPNKFIVLKEHNFLSSNGKCNTFAKDGDGYVPGEGVGAIFLKPIAKAISDNDHIYGVIKGGAINHGGYNHGYTVPNPNAQAEVIQKAIKMSEIESVDAITYIEAHGTGTALGDPIEIAGLTKAFSEYTKQKNYCAIGSVKTNIGHCESAAGIAALTKVILQMKYKKLVPSLHSDVINPNINFNDTPFYVQKELTNWKATSKVYNGIEIIEKRKAGISAFGAGGSNAHIIVEEYEYPIIEKHLQKSSKPYFVIILSAMSREQLIESARNIKRKIEFEKYCDDELESIAYTLQVGREAMEERLTFKCKSIHELIEILDDFILERDSGKFVVDNWRHTSNPQLDILDDYQKKWIKGEKVDWSKIYGNEIPRKISLSTYPFLKEHYWIESKPMKSIDIIHPLVHKNISTFDGIRFVTYFSGKESVFTCHKVCGKKVMPASAYVEMIREAIQISLINKEMNKIICLFDVVWHSPLVVEQKKTIDIFLERYDTNTVQYKVMEGDIENNFKTFNSGSVKLLPNMEKVVDIEIFRKRCNLCILDSEEVYGVFSNYGVTYSGNFKGIRKIFVGENSVLAEIHINPLQEETLYYIHPGVLDSAIQAAIGLTINNMVEEKNFKLPYSVEKIEINSPTENEMVALINKNENQTIDILLCTKSGKVCVEIYHLYVRKNNNMQNGTEKLFVPKWRKAEGIKEYLEKDENLVVFVNSEDQLVEAIELWGNKNVRYLADDITTDDIYAYINEIKSLKKIIVVNDYMSIKSVIDNEIIKRQEKCIIICFRLIKALEKLEYDTKELTINFITFSAAQIDDHHKINPTNASIQGFARAVAEEYSDWHVHVLDFTENKITDKVLCDFINNSEIFLAYRGGEWFIQKLSEIPYKIISKQSSFRKYGTYIIIGGAGGIGTVISEYLIKNYNASIIWLGRRKIDKQIEETMSKISTKKEDIYYLSVDAANISELSYAYECIKQRYTKINGVINSAVVLEDHILSNMSENAFLKVLRAKVDVCVRMAQVFGREELDFMLFFSSLQSFGKAFGQANYVAGCTFKDAFGIALNREVPYNVKIVNWGFWGDEGIVAAEKYRNEMAKAGVLSIQKEEAMKFLEYFLSSSYSQIGYMKVSKDNRYKEELKTSEEETYAEINNLRQKIDSKQKKINIVLTKIIYDSFKKIGILKDGYINLTEIETNITSYFKHFKKWIYVTLNFLSKSKIISLNNEKYKFSDEYIRDVYDNSLQYLLEDKELCIYYDLLKCLDKVLPDVLTGKVKATEALFPNGSMNLLEPLYVSDEIATYTNNKLALFVEELLKNLIKKDNTSQIKILEIGAGTGGTSDRVLEKIDYLKANIKEYCYTDISPAFLKYAQEKYKGKYEFVSFNILNIMDCTMQDERNKFDIVIGANVLHATSNIYTSLENIKNLLGENGVILLNELTRNSLFIHMVFGLLDGWWLYEDVEKRIEGSPLLSLESWKQVFNSVGFDKFFTTNWGIGQDIIVGKIMNSKKIVDYLKAIVSEHLGIDEKRLEIDVPLEKYGLDSIVISKITKELKKKFKSIQNSLFFEYQTIEDIAKYLIANGNYTSIEDSEINKIDNVEVLEAKNQLKNNNIDNDIAVIGLSGHYPKARNISEFWELLKNGKDGISEIPRDRWKWEDYYSNKKGEAQTIYTKWAGFIDDVDKFDPYFFGITPVEAEKMDPQERLFLQTAYECMEDSGYSPKELSCKYKVGVFVGSMNSDYETGASFWSIANRVSYTFDFHGPSMAIDTACSSSLSALHIALQSIKQEECDAALVGGVNLILSPQHLMRLCELRMLSSGNKAKVFGANADGIVVGEGIGGILLKPLNLALKDRDHIYAVIKGSAWNSGGKSTGYTVPNPVYQTDAIRECYIRNNILPNTIGYIETHGTGTSLGDPIEIEALCNVYKDSKYGNKRDCPIGSVKSNIGHSESAAGIAAITKVLLQLKHKMLVPSLNSSIPNENIDMNSTPFKVQQELEEWKQIEYLDADNIWKNKRRAAVSSFGAGGSNVHVVLEEYISEQELIPTTEYEKIIILSAKTVNTLIKKIKDLLEFLEQKDCKDCLLKNISYTLLCGRELMEKKIVFKVKTIGELKKKLEELLENSANIETISMNWSKKEKEYWEQRLLEENPKRISLPTYPFEKEIYWIYRKSLTGFKIHPLLHRNTSSYKNYSFTSQFFESDFFICDHIVNNQPIIAGVAYLEMARAAIENIFCNNINLSINKIVLKDILWIEPLNILENSVAIVLSLHLESEKSIAFKVSHNNHVYCTGRAIIEELEEIQTDITQLLDYMEGAKKVTGNQCYEVFHNIGIDYGKTFKALEYVLVTNKECLARICLPKELFYTENEYYMHPSLADAALQGIIAMNFNNEIKQSVPYRVSSIEFRNKCTKNMWVNIKVDSQTSLYKTDMYNDNGELCISISGIEIRAINDNIQSKNKELLHIYKPVFKINATKPLLCSKNIDKYIIILCDSMSLLHERINNELPYVDVYSLNSDPKYEDEVEFMSKLFNLTRNIMLEYKGNVFIQIILPEKEAMLKYAGCMALMRTAELENPKIRGQVLELQEIEGKEFDIKLIKETMDLAISNHFLIKNDMRYTYMLEEIKISEIQTPVFRDYGIYLIIGGNGGLGKVFAEMIDMVCCNSTIILAGRSEYSNEIVKRIERQHENNTKYVYMSVDVTVKEKVQALIHDILEQYGKINGIIYGAGVLNDSFMIQKDESTFRKTLLPKVVGLKNLDEETKNVELDFFAIHSSISAILGNVGQADYAMANAYMDEYAKYRNLLVSQNKRYGHTVSINWPLWEDGAMQKGRSVEKHLINNAGLKSLPRKLGFSCFQFAIQNKESQLIISYGDNKLFLNWILNNELLFNAVREGKISESEFISIMESLEENGGLFINGI